MSENLSAVYYGIRDIRLEDRPIPVPGAGEVLLRVGTVGVCGSDSGEYAHGPHQYPVEVRHPNSGLLGPVVPGHEFSGTVVAVGEGVSPDWIGTRVASCGAMTCGECEMCLAGRSSMCAKYIGVGLHRDGALAQFVATPLASCVSIEGTGLTLDEAALCQPMGIAVHCASRASRLENRRVLVLGVGGIGSFLTYVLVESGAEVFAADLDEGRLDIAAKLGAHHTLKLQGAPSDLELIREAVGDAPPSVIFEVSGSAGSMAIALEISPKGSEIIVVGMQKGPVPIDLRPVTLGERSLIGTNSQAREIDFPRAVELVARRAGQWDLLAPTVLPLSRLVEDALEPMSRGEAPAIKMLIDPASREERPINS